MFSLTRHVVRLSLVIAIVAMAGLFPAGSRARQERRQGAAQPATNPPVVKLAPNTRIVTVCGVDPSQATPPIELTTAVENLSGALHYTWSSTAGRVTGNNTGTATWDLSGAAPGTYTAMVQVANDREEGCMAFSSIVVRVVECPPPPCPNITIYCPENVTLDQPVTFSASVTGAPAGIPTNYRWTVSAGRIISGQGTTSIQVDTAGLAGQSITATLEVPGYTARCAATCTAQVPLRIKPVKFDEFPDLARDDEKARLDNFAIQLQNSPGAKGYIIIYAGRKNRPGDAQRRIAREKDYLINTRGLGADRIVTLVGSPREALTVELWIVPPGAAPPPVQ